MSSFILPANLAGLTPREAIADALYRAIVALDEKDAALLESALTHDVVLVVDGTEIPGLETITAGTITKPHIDTTHYMTNVRIDIKEHGATANMTANSIANHYPLGMGTTESERRFLRGAKHALSLSRDDMGLWKITRWEIKTMWWEGDSSVMGGPAKS